VRRCAAREARTHRLDRLQARVGVVRLTLAALTVAVAWAGLWRQLLSAWWLALPIAAFGAAVLWHRRLRTARAQAERAADFYRRGIARLEDRWAGSGVQGGRFNDPQHLYAADLDLFGRGSLFELLCTARTRMGEQCLARWLLSGAPPPSIRERQAAIAELAPGVDLREQLAALGSSLEAAGADAGAAAAGRGETAGGGAASGEAVAGVAAGAVQPLVTWAESANALEQRWIRPVSLLLPLLAIAAVVYWVAEGNAAPLIGIVLVEAAVLYVLKARVEQVLYGVENAFDGLALFDELLGRIGRERFSSASLQALMQRLSSGTLPAAQAMGRLARIANYAGSRHNQIGQLLAAPLMYGVQVALAAERWRRLHGRAVRGWVEAVGEFEALQCLAGYAHEHPDDPFAQLVEGPAAFDAAGLGHPLLPLRQCVRNDVSVTADTRVLLVSGSNMSGKSTLLRTVGINTVLAMAGAPVRARRLCLTPLQPGASIRINDSLQQGSSRFYAEISRIRALFDAAQAGRPVLFLLDELLQGTNSSDRRVGAEGIVRALVELGAIGLVSTHDLALTELRGLPPGSLRNVHFEDELSDGRMSFDYRLRDGVVTRSNAVELMRAVGLKV
jgi:hypothetical protein